MKKNICLILAVIFSSNLTNAEEDNFFQNYYDTSVTVITNLKKCSSSLNQFSNEVTQCYLQNSKAIQNKTNEFYNKNKVFFENKLKQNGDIKLDITNNTKINELKRNCIQTYPVPLAPHFKNQILECQAEIDLQRYFFFYTYKLNS